MFRVKKAKRFSWRAANLFDQGRLETPQLKSIVSFPAEEKKQ
jgi:hypothetical protein